MTAQVQDTFTGDQRLGADSYCAACLSQLGMGSWNSFAAVPDIADRGVAVSHLLKQGTEGAVAPVTRSLPGPPHGEPAAKQLYSTASADALTSSPMLSVFYGGGLPAPALSAPGQLADHPAAADESAHLTDVSGPQHRHSPAAHHNGGAGFSVRTDFSRPAHPGQGGFADFCAASAQCHAVSDASYAALRQAELLLARPRQQDAGDVSTDSGGLTIESGDGRGAAGHDAAQLQGDGDSPNASANGASPFDRAQVQITHASTHLLICIFDKCLTHVQALSQQVHHICTVCCPSPLHQLEWCYGGPCNMCTRMLC